MKNLKYALILLSFIVLVGATSLIKIENVRGLVTALNERPTKAEADTVYYKVNEGISATTYFYTKTQMDSVISNYLVRNPVTATSNIPAQNLVKYSETLENAVWNPTGLTVTANSAIDMNGATTLETVTASNVYNNLRYVNGSSYLPVTPGTTYKVSFDCRRGTMTDMKYSVMNNTTSTLITNATSYYSQTNANNVSRVSYTFTAPAGCLKVEIYLLRDSGAVGQTVYLGRVQVSTVSNAPYCVTTTTNVP